MTMRLDFNNAVEVLRKKWSIDPDALSESSKEAENEWLRFLEDANLHMDVKKMLKALKISASWTDVVHQYVVDGNLHPYNDTSHFITQNKNGLVLETNLDDDNEILLRVGPETTFSDFKIAWEEIKKRRRNTPPRKRDREKFIRDYEIFSMAREGMTLNKIWAAIHTKYGEDLEYHTIKKVVSVFYTRLKIPKKDRVELKTQ
jgi:hypothetical protein